MKLENQALKIASQKLLQEQPKLRTLAVAQALGVKERDLVVAECCGIQSRYLGEDYKAVFKRLKLLGEVMALTRNPWCVHERHGCYETIGVGEAPHGIVLGPDIDLRLFFSQWGTVWLVEQETRQSLQFFNRQGVAIHKVYITEKSNRDELQRIVEEFAQDKANVPPIAEEVVKPEYHAVPAGFREEWLALKDTHDFFPLLAKHKIKRIDALAAAGKDLAQQISVESIEMLLEQAVEQELPIMCFVGNDNMVQIHGGAIYKLLRTGPWFNILDPMFNLHLNTEAIDSVWVVNKPTVDGYVTSIEAYTQEGDIIVQFFGVRKPGVPENTQWRRLLESLCKAPLAA
ncbi:Hemin transport protein hemS [Oligella ureolytica]|uniref:hemin-degrading factor n=1 Tax=Oligella ureolytica TaxID=90244 RepID=UPI000DFB5813|nr:ChuX/HutX family heme-like substrate-binding protein [Oligella ureolytica]SUA54942.1 Hemin transport protein hemS [Oligella ureolytica]